MKFACWMNYRCYADTVAAFVPYQNTTFEIGHFNFSYIKVLKQAPLMHIQYLCIRNTFT